MVVKLGYPSTVFMETVLYLLEGRLLSVPRDWRGMVVQLVDPRSVLYVFVKVECGLYPEAGVVVELDAATLQDAITGKQ